MCGESQRLSEYLYNVGYTRSHYVDQQHVLIGLLLTEEIPQIKADVAALQINPRCTLLFMHRNDLLSHMRCFQSQDEINVESSPPGGLV